MLDRLLRRLRARLADTGGTALVLNLFALALFASLALVVFASAKSQVYGTVFVERQAQAQAIAEAGLEDALHSLYQNNSWNAGFTNKSFAGGSYTVTVTTSSSQANIVSTGYSASILLIGSAVRSVSAVATYTAGSCPYAVMADKGLSVEGRVDAYDPSVTLTPSATSFTTGANVWNNGNVTASNCPPVRIRGIAYAGNGGTGPAAACTDGGTVTSTVTLALPNNTCSGCTSLGALTIPANSTVTLTAGTYEYTKITLNNNSVLNVDTSSGGVIIAFDNNVNTNSTSQINNSSKIPSRLKFLDVSTHGAGHTVNLNCKTPLHAYIEGNDAQFNINQEVYGHFCGSRVDVSSATGAVGLVHYDIGGGLVTHVTAKSWQEAFKRQ